jgi:hypothetical protein
MARDAPIEVALNMHAAGDCKRYFVYHHAAGTSTPYTVLEQQFINGIRSYFPNGIEPWSYFVSWTSGTPDRYPESWFWLNHGENVMALTYEDMNCPEAGDYDSTAFAILHGIGDFLGLTSELAIVEGSHLPTRFTLHQNYPNPFNATTTITYDLLEAAYVNLTIYDLLGIHVASLIQEHQAPGSYSITWQPAEIPSGVYIYRLRTGSGEAVKKCLLLK